MDLISVIVPVYNVELYLDKCVQSIVEQTYQNLEIILVDDGSPDRCGEMCDAWAQKDSRIRVIHKENGGLSDARNAGMAVAKGEYIAFVDSDDWIESHMYEMLFEAIQKNNAQIAECYFEMFSDVCPANAFVGEAAETIFTAQDALRQLIIDGQLRQTVWNKLYRKSIIGDLCFPVGKLNEDEFWTYQVFGNTEKIVCVQACLYHYYQRSGSIIHVYNARRLDGLEAHAQRMQYITVHFPALIPVATVRWMQACLNHYQTICRQKDMDTDGKLRRRVYDCFCSIDRSAAKAAISFKYKVWYFLFRLCPGITCTVRNMLNIGI